MTLNESQMALQKYLPVLEAMAAELRNLKNGNYTWDISIDGLAEELLEVDAKIRKMLAW